MHTVFVLPEYQGKGIGKKIVETLEKDESFLNANKVKVFSSITAVDLTAVDFYKKLGYHYKKGVFETDKQGLVKMEKQRQS